jgi:hypothetical protein
VTVDNSGSDIHELAVGVARVVTQHPEGTRVVDRVAFHQDAFGTLGDSAPSERAFEIVVRGEVSPSSHVTWFDLARNIWQPTPVRTGEIAGPT